MASTCVVWSCMSSGGVVSVPSGEPAMVGTSADSRLAAHDRRAVYRPDVNLERECCRSVSGGAKQPGIQSAQWLILCPNNHARLRAKRLQCARCLTCPAHRVRRASSLGGAPAGVDARPTARRVNCAVQTNEIPARGWNCCGTCSLPTKPIVPATTQSQSPVFFVERPSKVNLSHGAPTLQFSSIDNSLVLYRALHASVAGGIG